MFWVGPFSKVKQNKDMMIAVMATNANMRWGREPLALCLNACHMFFVLMVGTALKITVAH